MPIIKPVISSTSVKNSRVSITAEENLRIGMPVALQGVPTELYTEIPADKLSAKTYSKSAFSADNKLLALYTSEFPVLYDISGNTVIAAPKTIPTGDVFTVAFSPTGMQLTVTCLDEDAAYIYDATTRPFTLVKKITVTRGSSIAYNRTGTRVVLYAGNKCRIYDTSSFNELTGPAGLTGSVSKFLWVTYSPDNSQMAIVYQSTVSSASSNYVGILDNRGLTPVQVDYYSGSKAPITVYYSCDGSSLMCWDSSWYLFDVTADSITKTTYQGDSAGGVDLLYHPTDGLIIDAAVGTDEANKAYAYFRCINTSGRHLKTYAEHCILSTPNVEDSISIFAHCISPDGALLAVQLRLYNGKSKSYEYLTRIYRLVWYATKATPKTQQFAQSIGCATQNIKAGYVGSALRII